MIKFDADIAHLPFQERCAIQRKRNRSNQYKQWLATAMLLPLLGLLAVGIPQALTTSTPQAGVGYIN